MLYLTPTKQHEIRLKHYDTDYQYISKLELSS